MKAIPVVRGLKKVWIPLVLIVVLAVSGLVVSRLHKMFASQNLNASAGAGIEIVQFNPKVLVYDVYGAPGTTPRSATSIRRPTCTRSPFHCRGRSPVDHPSHRQREPDGTDRR